jgi:adenosylmethionine-8-amino-7-oxononanoate aminotransferase
MAGRHPRTQGSAKRHRYSEHRTDRRDRFARRANAPGARAYDAFVKGFEAGLLMRTTGDVIALSPPLIIEAAQIDRIVSILGDAIKRVN